MKLTILGLYAGRVVAMPGDGRPTAIFKQPVSGRVRVGREGLEVDEQADLVNHGGPDKALHHFPLENHRRLASEFPDLAGRFVSGAIGENISTDGLDETGICLGDVFALGSARVQLSQPRTPCWKIDAKFGREGLAANIAAAGRVGWYYRVLAPGEVEAGDTLELIERQPDPISIAELWQLVRDHRPPPGRLERAADAPGLELDWRHRLLGRAEWLRRNAST